MKGNFFVIKIALNCYRCLTFVFILMDYFLTMDFEEYFLYETNSNKTFSGKKAKGFVHTNVAKCF